MCRRSRSRAQAATSGASPGEIRNAAPASTARSASSTVRTVPAPTTASSSARDLRQRDGRGLAGQAELQDPHAAGDDRPRGLDGRRRLVEPDDRDQPLRLDGRRRVARRHRIIPRPLERIVRSKLVAAEAGEVAADAAFERGERHPRLQSQLEVALEQAPQQPGHERVAGAEPVHHLGAHADLLHRPPVSVRRKRTVLAAGEHDDAGRGRPALSQLGEHRGLVALEPNTSQASRAPHTSTSAAPSNSRSPSRAASGVHSRSR